MLYRLGLVLGFFCLANVAQERSMRNDSELLSTGLAVSSVEALPEYVLGFPVYIAVTITADQGTSFSALRFANLLDLGGCLGMELSGHDGKLIVRSLPVPRIDEKSQRVDGTLRDGESRRMLTDFSTFIPQGLEDGPYRARIVYAVSRTEYHWSKTFQITFRSPNAIELSWLSAAAPDRKGALEWMDWTFTQPRRPVDLNPVSPDNPLKLNLVLRRVFFGPESLSQVRPDVLDVLTAGRDSKLYAPETRALKAELYQARGDDAEYQRQVTEILRATPGLQWWARMLENGGGFLKTFRLGPATGR